MQAMAKPRKSGERENATEERLRINLNRFIEESGYTMTQIADMIGEPQANFGRYARGEHPLTANMLPALSQVFGRSPNDFYERDPPPAPKDVHERQPLFLKSRPGFQPTDEDMIDWEEFLTRVRARRDKKIGKKK